VAERVEHVRIEKLRIDFKKPGRFLQGNKIGLATTFRAKQ
jgi:hypothetical protein